MKALYDGMSVPQELTSICTVGKYSYTDGGSPNIVFNKNRPHGKLTIGSFTSIGPHCDIYLGSEHMTNFVSTFPFSMVFTNTPRIECLKTKGDVVIGSDVWIGSYVIILSGVTIGHGAVIGAGSVVAKDVEPYSIVAGNPIREIRKRFTEDQIKKLLEIKWWEWNDDDISNAIPLLLSDNVEQFIEGA